MLKLTNAAVNAVKNILKEQKMEEENDLYLRVGVAGGGCNGFKFTLDLIDAKGEMDEEYNCDGVKVICDPKSYIYLDGTTVDYKTSTIQSGFVFDCPAAIGRCGCGSSFNI